MPYRFLEEIATADVAFEATAHSREELFIEGTAALLRTMVEDPESVNRRQELAITVAHSELDLLLFAFLQELVFLKDARLLLLHADEVRIREADGEFRLAAVVRGEEIDRGRHPLIVDVKAVTLHRLRVDCEDGIWRAVVVLDI